MNVQAFLRYRRLCGHIALASVGNYYNEGFDDLVQGAGKESSEISETDEAVAARHKVRTLT